MLQIYVRLLFQIILRLLFRLDLVIYYMAQKRRLRKMAMNFALLFFETKEKEYLLRVIFFSKELKICLTTLPHFNAGNVPAP